MRIAGWITKAIITISQCIIFIAFSLQQWFPESTSMLLYTYIACLVGFILLHWSPLNTNTRKRQKLDFTIVWQCIVTDSLWIKPTDALNSNFIGITTLHVSGSLSAHHQEFLAVHWLWYILCSSKRSSQLHKMHQSRCTAKNSWWWAERLP